MTHLLILGAGFSGKAIGQTFKAAGFSVSGTTRSAEKADDLRALGIAPILYDGGPVPEALAADMARATHVVQSIAPGKDGDPLFRAGMPSLSALMPKLVWAGYLSTVGVYGDHKGGWVDEDTALNPVSARSIERVSAENHWLDFGRISDLPVAVLRLAGIYGPGRNALRNMDEGTARRLVKKDQVFNRIRVEDIGRSALFLAEKSLGGVWNITDNEPGPPQDVVAEAARLMGLPVPPDIPFEAAELSPMARSFYGENKRVSNARLRAAGFEFRFPDYRQSLAELHASGRWRG
ncbi:SDR family NAD(P)-dependent oxidoreductase [Shinella sp. 838]|jgi:nucleoside-diphosphate-sugar epimerase|uniref:SDR family NAD(P)-dependent oxidoreductase n=1 Tax=unclassified Shinella TaxID=2643062 RepID=UPI0003C54586|nr:MULTISPECIES: SDR family NAD(P)-dependent oxidoreductase [unclassified Shinella]EYR83348.1 putative NAD-dependent epimerase/dehydratase [Shinella sp. DD12]MCA0341226.1 SDR family NAD(P)-dependent oxidoreductase [Pseudomonadota bacterium]MDG4671913.1 SDR family NAD(P)-dependent oxidoreductase [Shinella sp. 838]